MSDVPLPEPDGSAEANKAPHPGGGYEYDEVPAWSEPLVRAHAAAVSADLQARLLKMSDTMKAMDAHEAGLAEAQAYLMAENARLHAAIRHYEAALKEAWPEGAKGKSFEHWNSARIAIHGSQP
jgi:hypothetical protein